MVDRLPASLADPLIEIALYGRELSPLATGHNDIKDRLHDATQTNSPQSPTSLSAGNQRYNQRPFRIVQVTCILKVVPAILHAGDFSPNHLNLTRLSQTYES